MAPSSINHAGSELELELIHRLMEPYLSFNHNELQIVYYKAYKQVMKHTTHIKRYNNMAFNAAISIMIRFSVHMHKNYPQGYTPFPSLH